MSGFRYFGGSGDRKRKSNDRDWIPGDPRRGAKESKLYPTPGEDRGDHGPSDPRGDHGPVDPRGDHGPVDPRGDHGPSDPRGDHGPSDPRIDHGRIDERGEHGPVDPRADHTRIPTIVSPPSGPVQFSELQRYMPH